MIADLSDCPCDILGGKSQLYLKNTEIA